MNFRFPADTKLTKRNSDNEAYAAWHKGLHCTVLNRVVDADTNKPCYVVREYLQTDNLPDGEVMVADAAYIDANYDVWAGYEAWDKAHPKK